MTNAKPKAKPKAKAANSAFMKPMQPSDELAAIVGRTPLPRTEVAKKLWEYIKKNKLQDPKNKRVIVPNAELSKVLGKAPISMFAMTREVSKHLHETRMAGAGR